MKNHIFSSMSATSLSKVTTTSVPLNRLVNQLMTGLIPLAVNKKSFIINDVDQAISVHADVDVLAFVVGNLITNAINSGDNSCIRVEATVAEHVVQIRVRNNCAHFYSTNTGGFSRLATAARQMGGNISIHNQKNEGTTVVFSMAA
jgi:signal transduction histidine kinase